MLFKRASTLVIYWDGGVGWIENYASRTKILLTPPAIDILRAVSHWSSEGDIERAVRADQATVTAALDELVRSRLILTSNTEHAAETAFEEWGSWCPVASFFHQSTKDVPFVEQSVVASRMTYRLAIDPPPERTRAAPAISLPPPALGGDLAAALQDRRTWRQFGTEPVELHDLSTLLGLTWGTTGWRQVRENLAVPLRSSPSGGACQSIEVYVAARRVAGLAAGLYRYHSDGHGCDRIGDAPDDRQITHWVGGQSWVAKSAAVCFMTSVFERVQWKYQSPRAYRVITLEAGHLCQTFCLVATALKLAPFCSAALADTTIEQALGIDGIHESVLYAAGVGTRPPDGVEDPWSGKTDAPAGASSSETHP